MNKSDYYKHYQSNIELLECEIAQVKKTAQAVIGKKAWQQKSGADSHQITATEKEILACTRLFSFLICSWLEARLMKLIYENSTVAFSDTEIAQIRGEKQMAAKWKMSFLMAVCKSYGFSYAGDIDYSSNFAASSVEQQNYANVCGLFNDIADAITIRNRLAHGQWNVQFNSGNTAVTTYGFLVDYDNVQKLDILKQCYNHIADIIHAYVTYKDKSNPNFDQMIQKEIQLILDKKTRIQNSDYRKYESNLGRRYENRRNRSMSSDID